MSVAHMTSTDNMFVQGVIKLSTLTFVEMVRSLMYREARFSKHYERINADDDFHVEGLKLKPDEEPCGKFFPIPGLPEYVLFTSLGLHWIEGITQHFSHMTT